MSVAIRICILACLYNLKANRNQFSKYFEEYMILKDDCTTGTANPCNRSVKCGSGNMCYETFPSPPWATIFYGSRDQRPAGSLLHKRKEPGNEVAIDLCYVACIAEGRS